MDKGNKNQTLVARIICLLLSFGLWLYVSNVENPVRTFEVRGIPVEVMNEKALDNAGFAISNPKQFTVDLRIEGTSSEISKINKEDFKVAVDMSAYALKAGENTIPVQILKYPDNINIKNNGFLGIKINLEELTSKQLTIKSKVKISYKENIYEKDESINPDKVTISGAKSLIDSISQAIIQGEIKDLDRNYTGKYAIEFLDSLGNEINNVKASIYEAELTVNVDHGKSVPVRVNTRGELGIGLSLESMEFDHKYVNIFGDKDALNKVSEINTEVFDISNLTETTEHNLKLILPKGIMTADNLNSVKVKFNLSRVHEDTNGETSKSVVCNVQYEGLKEGLSITSSDPTVIVHLSGSQSDLDRVNSDNVSAVVDLSSINGAGSVSYTPSIKINNPAQVNVGEVGSVTVSIKQNE